jgi:hypothetical protein
MWTADTPLEWVSPEAYWMYLDGKDPEDYIRHD